jgi:PAS domain S-box-containing protein
MFICLLIFLPVGIFVGIVIDLHIRSLSRAEDMNTTLVTTALTNEWERKVRAITSLLARKLVQPMHDLDVSEMDYHADLAMKGEGFRYIYVYDEDGRILVDTTKGSKLLGEVLTDEFTRKIIAIEDLLIRRQSNIIDIAAPIRIDKVKMGIVRIGYSLEEIQKTIDVMTNKVSDNIGQSIKESIRNALFLLLVTVVPAFGFGLFFVRSLIKPIKRLVQGTEKISKGDLTYTIETRSSDEIGQLTVSFNKMTKDLQKTTVSRDYMDNIITSMVDTLIVLTPETVIQKVNQAACELLGYKEEELIGKPFEMVFSGDEQRIKGIFKEDLIREDLIHNVEETYISKDGRKIPVLFSASVMCDVDGILRGIICVALDITERKRVENILETRARQQDIVAYLGQKALAGGDLTTLMNEVVRRIAETFDNEYCKVLELLPDGNALLLRAGVGWKEGLVGQATVHTGLDSQAGYTLQSNKPVIVEDLRTETRFSGPPLLHEHNVVSGMSVIIQGQKGPWGVLGSHTKKRKNFSKEDIYFLQSVSNLLADAITRKSSEEALRNSEEGYRKLIETAQDAIISIDENEIISVWNSAAEKIFGYLKHEIIGQSITTIIPERYREQHEEGLQRFLKTGETRIMDKIVEVHGITNEGIEIPIGMSLSFQKNEEGLCSFTAIIRDITERKKREDEIQRLSCAVEQSPSSVMITDAEGNIEYINPKFTELTGYTPEDALGKTPRILKSGKTPLAEYKKLWKTIKSGKEWRGEFSNKKKNGILYWEHTSISSVKNSEGNITHFVSVNEDVTDRRHMEKMIKKSEEVAIVKMKEATEAKENAEVATTAKSEFLANMSHEIRTPMNGIMGMTDLLLDTKLTREQREFTDTVRDSADALLTIINDILDFSKIEAGKMEIENIDFDLHIAVESTIDILAVKAHEKYLELSCFIDPEVPSLLRGDPGKLRQVIINLVNNAMKFTKEGEVAISVNMEEETELHVTVRFAVKDTGIGIPADRMDRLFKSFSQVDASTTRKFGGTGLGLTISKQIAELMGGHIGVESKEGKGSTFWFTAVLEKQPLDQQQAPIKLGDIENMRVLVVDGYDTNRHIFRKYLESWHCRVEEAVSAEEVMEKLRDAADRSDPFKIALIDCCMPEKDGESLGREIKADPQLKDLILVMLTSVGRRGDAELFSKLGFAAYLPKPIKKTQLFECLQIVTGKTEKVKKDTPEQIVTQYSISEDHKQRVHILLVEDNMVNQKIALRILEKKLGYHADVATNGKEAIESLERSDYDLVLMDCQMPEMDGYEATSTIRDQDSAVRNHNIPIIAMTANAMKGDREKCLEAGMDDYVTKPINMQELADAIERNLSNGRKQQLSPASVPEVTVSKEAKQEDVPEGIYSEYADDADLVELVDEFAAGLEADVESMRKVLENGDHDGLRRLAHQMKGAGGSYGYPMLTEAAKAIEEAAKTEDNYACMLTLDKFTILCQAVVRGRKVNITISDC